MSEEEDEDVDRELTEKEKEIEDILAQLHGHVAEGLTAKIKAGAEAAYYNAAIKFLADNGINCDAAKNAKMRKMHKAVTDKLPFDEDGDKIISFK